MARFPSIDETGAFEAPEVQNKIKELVAGGAGDIRVDTSVGTRAFVGDTMIHGDTGWRTLSEWDADGNVSGYQLTSSWAPNGAGGIFFRRVNERIYVDIVNLERLSETIATVWDTSDRVPLGFRPSGDNAMIVGLRTVSEFSTLEVSTSGLITRLGSSLAGDNGVINISDSYATDRDWPTSLPGTPA